MDALTFRPVGEVAAFVTRKADFLRQIEFWSAAPEGSFPLSKPPVDCLRDIDDDENAILARIFRTVAKAPTVTERLSLLSAAIEVHRRRHDIAWDRAKAQRDPRFTAPRDGFVALRPYALMIGVIEDWREAIFDQATGAAP